MRILIVTGIYPPKIGGPAKYAKNLKEEWSKSGHTVKVKTFGIIERVLPSLFRHFFFLIKTLPSALCADVIFALDTFSVGFPTVILSKVFRKKIIIRTGGDFLWEGYVERTGDLVLLKDFYKESKRLWSLKERIIFRITKWTLRNASALIFSTEWQKEIFIKAYNLPDSDIFIVENYYGQKKKSGHHSHKNFIGGTRKLKWKNLELLKESFEGISEAKLDLENYLPEEFEKKIGECYAVILVSLGDISPNMILEAIQYEKPFIITRENGLMNRIGNIALTVDPESKEDIRNKILWLLDEDNYKNQAEKIRGFNFTHSWSKIANEIIGIFNQIQA